MKFSSRNWKYLVIFYFYFLLKHQAVLFLLSGEFCYSGTDFYLLSILFSPTDCRISTFYIKNESSEPWHELQAQKLAACRKYLAPGAMLCRH